MDGCGGRQIRLAAARVAAGCVVACRATLARPATWSSLAVFPGRCGIIRRRKEQAMKSWKAVMLAFFLAGCGAGDQSADSTGSGACIIRVTRPGGSLDEYCQEWRSADECVEEALAAGGSAALYPGTDCEDQGFLYCLHDDPPYRRTCSEDPNCTPPGEPCEENGQCCGWVNRDAYCVNWDDVVSVCSPVCHDITDDCNSGCCEELNNGASACTPDGSFCACSGQGEHCDSRWDCCGFTSDKVYCVRFDTVVACTRSCSVDSDCPSDCCVPLDTGELVCALDDSFCSSNDACAECLEACHGLPACCTGTGCMCDDECP